MWWTFDALFSCFGLITCKVFLSGRCAHLISQLPNKQKQFMSAKLKNDVNDVCIYVYI